MIRGELPLKKKIFKRIIRSSLTVLLVVTLAAALAIIGQYGYWVRKSTCTYKDTPCVVSQKIGGRDLLIETSYGPYLIRNNIVYMIDSPGKFGQIIVSDDIIMVQRLILIDASRGNLYYKMDGTPDAGDSQGFNARLHVSRNHVSFYVFDYENGNPKTRERVTFTIY